MVMSSRPEELIGFLKAQAVRLDDDQNVPSGRPASNGRSPVGGRFVPPCPTGANEKERGAISTGAWAPWRGMPVSRRRPSGYVPCVRRDR